MLPSQCSFALFSLARNALAPFPLSLDLRATLRVFSVVSMILDRGADAVQQGIAPAHEKNAQGPGRLG
jgi:hypothetical protein